MYHFWMIPSQFESIEAMSTSKKVITREEWEKKLKDVKIRKEDMNKLVMNFLVTEGYVDAAEKFRIESGTEPELNLATIADRMAVKRAVQSGNVQDAIEKVIHLNPEILNTNPHLYFHLQQQKLIELIRYGKVEEALEFAQEELAPRGEENQNFLEELERTVALLAFEDVKNCPFGELLDLSQRLKTASEVNAAILTSQSHEKDPKLPRLLKMLIWIQNQLDEKAAYPRINDLTTAALEEPTSMAHSTSLFASLSSPAAALRFHHRHGTITAGRRSSLKVFFPSAGDLRPELDENPEAIISGEWAPNFSLLSYDDLLDYIRSQPPAKKHVGSKTLLREVMSTTVRAARAEQSLGEIADHFEFVSGLPVVDDERRCLGVVCKTDLAKANHEVNSKVADIMSSPAITLTPEKTVKDAAALMLRMKIHRIPILNQQKQVIGMVTRSDIFEALQDQSSA